MDLSPHSLYMTVILMVIPIALSSFIYLWNPLGFPSGTSYDEGIYLRRAMHVLNGLGPQENQKFYDHPYFGQLFLATFFWSIGYPDLLDPSSVDANSIEGLYLFPRLLMGTLAIFDTFLLYLISERRYNRRVAFAASLLFAGMPLPLLLLRRVWLEPIQLPFIMSSILFALWLQGSSNNPRILGTILGNRSKDHGNSTAVSYLHLCKRRRKRNAFSFASISGALLGISVFTKVPAFTFIPLVAFLIYDSLGRNGRTSALFVWLVSLLGIAMIWPVYSFSIGEGSAWINGILWQTNREGRGLFYSLQYDLAIDPVLLVLSGFGLVYAIIRKDLFIVLWIIPFFVFLYLIGFVSFWHLIPTLPAFCIAIARVIDGVASRILTEAFLKGVTPLIVVIALVTVEIAYTAPSIIGSSNQSFFSSLMFLTDYLKKENDGIQETSPHEKTETVIGDPSYLWVPQYVFNLDNFDYKTYFDDPPSLSKRALIIADQNLVRALSMNDETSRVLYQMYSSNHTKKIVTLGDNNSKGSQVSILSYNPPSKFSAT